MKMAHRLEAWLLKVWYENLPPGLLAGLALRLLSTVYTIIWKLSKQDKKTASCRTNQASPTVLIVGNLIAGGAGKTPIVQAVCTALQARGYRVGILTRGYKRKETCPLVIEPNDAVDSEKCGDEPAWLHQHTNCPISVCADRKLGLENLIAAHPEIDLVVCDDGLQHHKLKRQLEWVVFDERATGNGKLLPEGPLREPLSRLASVDAIVSSSIEPAALAVQLGHIETEKIYNAPVKLLGFENAMTGQYLDIGMAKKTWLDKKTIAFTGLANPSKFFKALTQHGLKPVDLMALPDHYKYPDDFCSRLNCDIALTTGKDAVKLNSYLHNVWVARIHVDLPDTLIKQIEAKIGRTNR